MTDRALAHEVTVEGEGDFAPCPPGDWFAAIVRTTLAEAGFDRPAEVGLLITSDEAVRDLNARYRGLDEPTDVLSFALLEGIAEGAPGDDRPPTPPAPGFLMPPDGLAHLGEVIISYPRAADQARAAGHSTDRELAHLTAHGVLHLLGYDHLAPDEEAMMRAKENAVLGRIRT